MLISQVSQQDAVACAQLIRALQAARFDGLSGKDIEAYMVSKKWIAEIGLQIANQLPGPHREVSKQEPAPTESLPVMKIRSMGPLPGGPATKKSRKKK